MTTVILVGAGATLAEALPAQTSKSSLPPLDRTFFDLCSRAKLQGLHTVASYMYDTYGIDPVGSRAGMEEVFNYLYTDAIGPNSTDGAVDAYWALIKMYSRSITDTTHNLLGKSYQGIGAVIRFLWGMGEHELSIVTFNQDLVIENSLEEAIGTKSYSGIPWSIKDCYETTFEDIWTPRSGATFSFGNPDSIRVLKLHGSLNWVYKARSMNDARNSLRHPSGTPGLLMRRRLSKEFEARDNGRRVHLLPLIVPPIYEKSQHLREQLDSVWSAAQSKLSACDRLIVFGYSFPPADFAAAALLRRAFVANKSLNELEVINPDPSVIARAGAITQAPSIRAFVDVSAFKSSRR